MKKVFSILFTCFFFNSKIIVAQNPIIVTADVVNGDTLPYLQLNPVFIIAKREFKDPYEEARFNQLRYEIHIVWPYAKAAAQTYQELIADIPEIEKRKDKKKYLKEKQAKLESQFEDALKNMTTTQGELLVKLISRQTGRNAYALIKTYKSTATALFWNAASNVFGYSLKYNYDPDKERDIEMICRTLELNGE